MPLHRYITPTYFGGLPVTHDLINVVSGGIGAGDGSALVAPQKPGPHPNAGTYFVAFGEDATSADANRGLKAVAENTDYLDDVVHGDQSIPTVSSSVTPVAPVTSLVIPGNIFVGGGSEVNDQRTRSGLVSVLDGDGIPLHVLSGTVYVPVLVSKIHNGTGTSVIGSGYFVNPTIDLVPAIPTSQAYRLVFYTRGNLVSQPPSAYTRLANGVRGEEDLWAYAKTTRVGTVTFEEQKTFQDPVTFEDVVEAQDTILLTLAAQHEPRIHSDLVANDVLILQTKVKSSPNIYSRLYARGTSGDEGFALTYNAYQDPGTGDWKPDTVDQAENPLRVLFGHSGVVIQAPLTSFAYGDPIGTDSDWSTSANFRQAIIDIAGELATLQATFVSDLEDSTKPFLRTTKGAFDDPAGSARKLLGIFRGQRSGTGSYARVFTDEFGDLEFTINAAYDPGTDTWSLDRSASNALYVRLRADDASIEVLYQNDSVGPWASWLTGGSLSASMVIAGEYLYAAPKSRTTIVPISSGVPVYTAGVVHWQYGGNRWISKIDSGGLGFPVIGLVPVGSTITSVSALVIPGDSTDDLALGLTTRTPDFGTPGVPPVTFSTTATATGTAAQVLTITPNYLVTSTEDTDIILVAGSNAAAVQDNVYALVLTYDFPGIS